MIPSVDEMLQEHIPYRLTHFDGLVWASEKLLQAYRPSSIAIQCDGQETVSMTSIYRVTNPLFEVGMLHCRVLLEFLGVQLDKAGTRLAARTKRHTDDFGIVQLSLPYVTVPQVLAAPIVPSGEIERAMVATLLSADKGVAHFTTGTIGRAYIGNSLVCAKKVTWCVEEYVYRTLSRPIPTYKWWTAQHRASADGRSSSGQ